MSCIDIGFLVGIRAGIKNGIGRRERAMFLREGHDDLTDAGATA